MAKPASRSSDLLFRVGVGILAIVLGLLVLQWVLSWLFGLIKVAILLAVLGIALWFVLIGPPGWGDKDS
jgi:undecaprenyl pyrophosphate phosphatase UppP